MDRFVQIAPTDITDNVFKLLDKDWMLVPPGKIDNFNTMTASGGHLGVLWSMPVAIAYIRPQRYTYQFANKYPEYTLTFFEERYRPILQFCGSRSGRNVDKVAETGLTPLETERGNVIFKEARLALECRKIYEDDLKIKNFLLPEVAKKNYPKDDFHRFYMGEIVNVWKATD